MNAAQGGDIVEITENAYKYNVNGYPVRQKRECGILISVNPGIFRVAYPEK